MLSTLVIIFVLILLCAASAHFLATRSSPLAAVTQSVAFLLLPTLFIFLAVPYFAPDLISQNLSRLFQTLIGIELIWIALSLVKAFVLLWGRNRHWQTKVPGLFLDLVRMALAILGGVLVTASVWDYNPANFLATLGVGSLVLGLALQETLGNLFAGIALLFEKPFKVGDWIRVGGLTGEVIATNWRAVRLRSRDHVMIDVPNAVLGREKIENFNEPTSVCGVLTSVGFSYTDPPTKVKKVLFEVLSETPRILKVPNYRVRTKDFHEYRITYEVRFFIDDFAQLPEIEEDFKTRVWYAARRYGLSVPLPTRIVQKTEMPPPALPDPASEKADFIQGVSIFDPLSPDELQVLDRDAVSLEFGNRERVVEQGQEGDSLYIIRKGTAIVLSRDSQGKEQEVARLTVGDFFGEMALLTGETRTATVVADGDLSVLVVYKKTLQYLLENRPELATMMAEIAESRRVGLNDALVAQETINNERNAGSSGALLSKIKNFFGI